MSLGTWAPDNPQPPTLVEVEDDDAGTDEPVAQSPEEGPASTVGATLVPPSPRFRPKAVYPADAPAVTGPVTVALTVRVDTTGKVVAVRVVRGAGPVFDRAAQRIARRVTFSPARRGDRPIAMWVPWKVVFR